ncbi:MAG: MerR family transcriptional regulator [Spirochaetales bacterium]|nr:MerR family transcriptional regulator [Spirochaetales bacterium]
MYQIGDVCRLLSLKPHVLRYWEKEIPLISPRKDTRGIRVYSKQDVNLLFRLRHLLYEKRYTIEGAKQQIWEEYQGLPPETLSGIQVLRSQLIELHGKSVHLLKKLK